MANSTRLWRTDSTSSTVSVTRATSRTQLWRNFDFVLLGTVLILIVYGILMISSATHNAQDTDLISRVPSQIQYSIIGIVVLFVMASIDYRLLGALHRYIYGLIVFLLGMVTILGKVGAAGAQRWLTVVIPVQPSEIAKLLLVIALAQHLQKQYTKLDKLQTVLVSLGYIGLPARPVFPSVLSSATPRVLRPSTALDTSVVVPRYPPSSVLIP